MLWKNYVFRRGTGVITLWNELNTSRKIRLLVIAGRGFDSRGNQVIENYVKSIQASDCEIESAKLLLVGVDGYELSDELHRQTQENEANIRKSFSPLGEVVLEIFSREQDGEDLSVNVSLRDGNRKVLKHLTNQTDVVLDVSSLPRIVYLSLLTTMLAKLIPNRLVPNALYAQGVNFQVLVAEDAKLDAKIVSADPTADQVRIPGFSAHLDAESVKDRLVVWFPILGEGKQGQFELILSTIPESAEICPVLPHPASNPRRGDELLIEYGQLLAQRQVPPSNVLYAHESNPFEAYRQLHGAMSRFKESLKLLGGGRVAVTPLASKLITLGTALACFEMQGDIRDGFGVAIPYAAPRRYQVDVAEITQSKPQIAVMLLTGDAYNQDTKLFSELD